MKFITISLLSVLILQCSSKGVKRHLECIEVDDTSSETGHGSEQARSERSEECGVPDEKYTPSIEVSDGQIQSMARGIVGGDEAVEHSFPWQVYLFLPYPGTNKGESCGGTLISNQWVVTAAHCFVDGKTGKPKNDDLTSTRVFIGQHMKWTGTEVKFSDVIVHPKYGTEKHIGYDIALGKLAQPVTFTDTVKPICLPSESDDFHQDEGNVIISGWGKTSEGGSTSTPLLQAVTTLSWTQCKKVYGPNVNENEICAYSEGLDTCQGDSGGPLVTYDTDHFVLAGVVSWGKGCAESGYPGVYVNVPFFRGWITDHTGL